MRNRAFLIFVLLIQLGCAAPPIREPAARPPVTAEALLQAAAGGQLGEATRILSSDSTLVHARDARNLTPLHLASRPGISGAIAPLAEYGEVAKLLIEHGADVNSVGEDGVTPLYLAASYPTVGNFMTYNGRPFAERLDEIQMGTITALLDAGAEIDKPTEDGFTAVQAAVAYEHSAIAVYLINRGADVYQNNKVGWNACKRAFNDGDEAVQEICRERRAAELSSPESTLEGYINALRNGDSSGVSRRFLDGGFKLKAPIPIESYSIVRKYEFGQKEVDEWQAIPPAKIGDVGLDVRETRESGELMISYWLRNVEGEWKVFSLAAWGAP